jgi:hypothetical protein
MYCPGDLALVKSHGRYYGLGVVLRPLEDGVHIVLSWKINEQTCLLMTPSGTIVRTWVIHVNVVKESCAKNT